MMFFNLKKEIWYLNGRAFPQDMAVIAHCHIYMLLNFIQINFYLDVPVEVKVKLD